MSDRFEKEERDPPSSLTKQMERGALKVIGADWCRKVDRSFLDNLGKYRKYDGGKVVDLLRAMRNKVTNQIKNDMHNVSITLTFPHSLSLHYCNLYCVF